MSVSSRRVTNGLGFVTCMLLIGYALYLEHVEHLEPCPLCIFQRLGFIAVGILFLLAALHHPRRLGARIYAVAIGLAALAGGAVSVRHVWLQHLPPGQVPECGPGLEYMLDVFPLAEVLKMVLTGSGECAEVDWTFVGLSMPAWALIGFVILAAVGVLRNWMLDARE